ncbi:polysaccharide pyruvyl transferase family protein [Acidovorax sp. sif1233]|uniref:polysaccharide pyruvyl transferase family protein n=2 Tax=Acidovorax TaxID=12916 RepID=UPI001C4910F0|nr:MULTISPECIES: polysaccharide pyruvyl transferase family protein [unclassified Acidovorax]MBV7429984.1 polysaccharide pyruvyl transferase family protein [Acidovorax sp. sif0732]MBV7451377.1 polysaccharide pyruvyl transferase family protein [Acidovorax sp. sif0715]MBV7454459.1 polysaccharide pyruvyl transferase family protein [Acidovorax sp. sif1233]
MMNNIGLVDCDGLPRQQFLQTREMNTSDSNAMKNQRSWRIGIFGTFDVQNYGDLLFPIIAELELSQRLGNIELVPFSYHAKSSQDWPYGVESLADLPRMASGLDAILIGGGFIVRFDKFIAPGYEPPVAWIQHPTGYWLTPALLGAQHGVPVIWNAPGMHCNDIPSWSHPLLSLALECSTHIAVRDEPSKTALMPFVDPQRVHVMPDTAFSIRRCLKSHSGTDEADAILKYLGLKTPYIVIQATQNLERFTDYVKKFRVELPNLSFLLLRLGPVLCDHESFIDADLPGTFCLGEWPSPMALASLISGSEAVVGHSYHLAITALSCGIPVFSSSDLSQGKFTALSKYSSVHPLPPAGCEDPEWLSQRIGRKEPSQLAIEANDVLENYWDHVADMVRSGKTDSMVVMNAFWMSLPGILERESRQAGATRSESPGELQDFEARLSDSKNLLDAAKTQLIDASERSLELEKRLLEMQESISWRMTAPLRSAWRWVQGLSI